MAKTQTLYVFPNPYAHLDHRGWLAGGCPMAEGRRSPTAMPALRKIGAEFKMIPGTYNANPDEGRGPGGTLAPKAEYEWSFPAAEPIALQVDASTMPFYASRAKAGDVFVVAKADDLPLEQLAAARLKAVADFRAAYGDDPDLSHWAKQFALDETVAKLCAAIEAKRKAEAQKAEAEAKKAEAEEAKKPKAEPKKTLGDVAFENAMKKLNAAPAAKHGANAPTEQ